jgi:hypothetical protein
MFDILRLNPDYVFPEPLMNKDGMRITTDDLEAAVNRALSDLEGYAYEIFAYSCRHTPKHPLEHLNGEFPPYIPFHLDADMLNKYFRGGLTESELKFVYPSEDDYRLAKGIFFIIASFMFSLGLSMKDVTDIRATRGYQFKARYRRDGALKETDFFPPRSTESFQKLEDYYRFFTEKLCFDCKRLVTGTECGNDLSVANAGIPEPVVSKTPTPEIVAEDIPYFEDFPLESKDEPTGPVTPQEETVEEASPEAEERKEELPEDYIKKIKSEGAAFPKDRTNTHRACYVLMRALKINNGIMPSDDGYRGICKYVDWDIKESCYNKVLKEMKESPAYDKATGRLDISYATTDSVKAEFYRFKHERERAKRLRNLTQTQEEAPVTQTRQAVEGVFQQGLETEETTQQTESAGHAPESDFIFAHETLAHLDSEVSKWEREINELRAQNLRLTNRLTLMETERESLLAQHEEEEEALTNDNKALMTRIMDLTTQNNKIESGLQDLKIKNKDLEETSLDLRSRYNKLKEAFATAAALAKED